MHDYSIDKNADIQKRVARAEARAELRVMRRIVVRIVRYRFRALIGSAVECIQQIDDPDKLDQLILSLSAAQDETSARWLLVDENPDVQERVSRAEARAELRTLQQLALDAVKQSFPALLDLVQERIEHISKPDELRRLVIHILKAPDETSVRTLLQMP